MGFGEDLLVEVATRNGETEEVTQRERGTKLEAEVLGLPVT